MLETTVCALTINVAAPWRRPCLDLGRTFVGVRQRSRARWSSFPRHFTQVQKRVAHELQHNAAVEAVVVVTVPRGKLDNSVDWLWGLARGVVGGSL